MLCITLANAGWREHRRKAFRVVASSLKQSEEDAIGDQQFSDFTTIREIIAGSFLAASSYTLTRVDVYLAKDGNPTQDITCRILAASGSPGDPNASSVLGTSPNTRDGADIGVQPVFSWCRFDFTGVTITSGTYYYIELTTQDGSGSSTNNYYWLLDTSGGASNTVYLKEFSAAWSGTSTYSSIQGANIRIYGF